MAATAATTLDLELPKYNLVNLSMGMELARGFSAVVYVNNLTDEKYINTLRYSGYYGAPRNYTLSLNWRF